MSAEIRPFPGSASSNKRLELAAKLEGHQDVVNFAILLKNEEGVISTSEDKTVMIWLKRDAGHYWPSVCHKMPAAGTSMHFNHETKRLFVGMDNGTISEFVVGDDYNKITHKRNYLAHSGRVTGIVFSALHEWVLSVSRDKYFSWHCSKTGNRISNFLFMSWVTALQFDEHSRHLFAGSQAGSILMIKLNDSDFTHVAQLKGHSDAIRCLAWDPEKKILFSGSNDKVIICWDIGGKRGTAYELQGHHGKITSLNIANQSKLLISASDDAKVVFWKMDVKRTETPEWLESNACQNCSRPFFWNIEAMLATRTIGLRQHHCRRCGQAVCDSCSSNKSNIPTMGFEFQVRICDKCKNCISEDDLQSLATSYDTKHSIMHSDLDESRSLLITSGTDRIVKVWKIKDGPLEKLPDERLNDIQVLPPEPPPLPSSSLMKEKMSSSPVTEKDKEMETEIETIKNDCVAVAKQAEKPIRNERILLRIRKIKKHSKKHKTSIEGDSYNYQIFSQKDERRRNKRGKVEFDKIITNLETTNNITRTSACKNNLPLCPRKTQAFVLSSFFEAVEGCNQVQTNLPNEILVKIFTFVVEDESKAISNLLNLCRTCDNWRQLIMSTPKLWRYVDLSDLSKKPSENDLVKFAALLVNTTHLNFSGWGYSLTYPHLDQILNVCGKTLTSIVLRGCYAFDGTVLDLLDEKCPLLQELDLSRSSPSSEQVEKKRSSKKSRKVSYPLFTSLINYLTKNGARLRSLNLSENKLNSLTHVFTNIIKHCPDLRSLDLSNIESTSSFLLRIDQLQESCPNLQILRLGNVFIQPPKTSSTRGFPKLEELSIPCNNQDYGYSESIISSLTKDAENLKLLDIRGSPRVTASCIIKIPAWNLQHLAIDNCSTIFSTGLEMIASKWKHSLIELDISHNFHTEGISAALEVLSSEVDCPLKTITLRGSSVLFESIEKLIKNCKNLRSIDLQSCRALPRGTKRVFIDQDIDKFRAEILNGRYANFDQ